MLNDLFNLMDACVDMSSNYDDRKVERTELDNGIVVSTVYTTDCGYETALILSDGEVCPVERYSGYLNREEIKQGHFKWVKFADENYGKEFKMLGYGSSIDDIILVLK